MVLEDFVLPFEGKLDANNRWVKLAKVIPPGRESKKIMPIFSRPIPAQWPSLCAWRWAP
jgi:hypothetical protein